MTLVGGLDGGECKQESELMLDLRGAASSTALPTAAATAAAMAAMHAPQTGLRLAQFRIQLQRCSTCRPVRGSRCTELRPWAKSRQFTQELTQHSQHPVALPRPTKPST